MEYIIKEHTSVSLTFSHGDLSPEVTTDIRCEMLSEIPRPHKVAKVVVSNSSDNLYLGNIDNSNVCDNFIAIRNKSTNSVRFHPVDNFFMCPFRGIEERRATFQSNTKSAKQSLAELNNYMGSKKIRKRLIAAERNSATLADLKNSVLPSNESSIDASTEIEPYSPVIKQDYLPPGDRKTKQIDEAYKIHDLVSQEILDSVEAVAVEVMNMDLFLLASDSRFSPFIMKAVTHVPKDLPKYKLLLFIDRLLAYSKSSPRFLSDQRHTYCSFSTAVHEKIIEEFSVPGLGGKRLRTPTMRDKILCYASVLIMICCNYEIDIGMLAGIVAPADHKRLPALLKALGAISGKSSPSIFKLKVPIGDPKDKIKRHYSGILK